MTCQACERRIEKQVRKIPGVTEVRADSRRGRVLVTSNAAIEDEDIIVAVMKAGYDVGRGKRPPWLSADRSVWRDAAIGLIVVAVIVAIMQIVDTGALTSSLTKYQSSGGVLGSLLLGLAAGFSTCIATAGGIALSAGAQFAARHPDASTRQRFGVQVAFNAGRIAVFALGGAVLGAAGSFFAVSGRVLIVLLVIAALVMALMGVRLSGVSPRLSNLVLTLPGAWGRRLTDRLDGGREDSSSNRRTSLWPAWTGPALLGAATFLVPCAFTQAAQLLAFATGDPVRSALVLGAFAVGTTPGLLAVAGVTAAGSPGRVQRLTRSAGVVVVAFAVLTAVSAGALWRATSPAGADGIVIAGPSDVSNQVSENVSLVGGVQVMRMNQEPGGYTPEHSVVHVGTPVRWEVTSSGFGCASVLVAPQAGVTSQLLTPGETFVTEFTPTTPGTWSFTCGMGMVGGTVTVLPTRA